MGDNSHHNLLLVPSPRIQQPSHNDARTISPSIIITATTIDKPTNYHGVNKNNNNNSNGIEPPPSSLSPPSPLPPPVQQTTANTPAESHNSFEIDTRYYRPNGGRLRTPDVIPHYSNFWGRRQQGLELPGKQVIGFTNTRTAIDTVTNSAHSSPVPGTKTSRVNGAILKGDGGRVLTKKKEKNNCCSVVVYSKSAGQRRGGVKKIHQNTVKSSVLTQDSSQRASNDVRISTDFDNSVKGSDVHLSVGNGLSLNLLNPRISSSDCDVFTPHQDVKRHARDVTTPSSSRKLASSSRILEDRIRSMYSQRRLHAPASARSYGHRPRSSAHGRPHSSRGASMTSPCMDDDLRNRGHHTNGIGLLAKFRLVARMTIILIRLMKAIIENSNDLTTRSAAELQWLTVYGRDTESAMAFNKHVYSRDRVMTHIPEWAMAILQLDPERRTELHCRRLHALLRGLKSFDKFTDEIQMSLCRAFRLEIVTEGRILLKHGHIGVYFYFIYSGSVFVNAQDKAPDGKPFMRTITVLTRGQSFGELALLQDIKRTATVSVREKCELLVVDKEVFARVCPQIFEKELEEKRNVLSGMSLFPSKWWGPEDMRALSMEAQIQEFKINKVIVPDSSLEDWIYTCIEGKCQVIHCLSLSSKTSDSGDKQRKTSDIVLSEEIIDLLSSATTTVAKTNEQEVDADIKEKLLSSLGLDYVATGKRRHAYVKDDGAKERLRAIQGLDDATTLTSLMKKREETRKGLVYLNVGVIEPGEVFDLHSLVSDDRDTPSQTSCLMLVSGGAKILKVRKAAFYEHASDQAIEHTRTLASKQRFLSDESLIQSYKDKKKWERYKTDVVHSVLTTKQQTRGGQGRSNRDTLCNSRTQTPRPKSSRHIRSAGTSRGSESRQSSHNVVEEHLDNHINGHTEIDIALNAMQKENRAPQESLSVETPDSDNNIVKLKQTQEENLNNLNMSADPNNTNTTTTDNNTEPRVKIQDVFMETIERPASIVPSFDTDALIIRRNPARTAAPRGKLVRSVGSRPHTVHPRFSTR